MNYGSSEHPPAILQPSESAAPQNDSILNDVKEEPPADYVLELPPTIDNRPTLTNRMQQHTRKNCCSECGNGCKLDDRLLDHSYSKLTFKCLARCLACTVSVKQEPLENFEEAAPTNDSPAPQPEVTQTVKEEPKFEHFLVLKPKWVKSVELTRLDAKWSSRPALHQTFLTCSHCQLLVTCRSALYRHLKTCGKMNPDLTANSDVLNYQGDGQFCCTKCGFAFRKKENLQKHSRQKKTFCLMCGIKFSCKRLMHRHRSEFHGNVYKCDKCPYQTQYQTVYTRHKGTHDKSLACETCNKKFSIRELLKDHQLQHRHGIHATPLTETFDCVKCDKSFPIKSYLRKHQQNVHDEVEAKCDVCGKTFKNKISMRNHTLFFHKKVKCSVCSKMFLQSSMPSHLQWHSRSQSHESKTDFQRSLQQLKYAIQKNALDRNALQRFTTM